MEALWNVPVVPPSSWFVLKPTDIRMIMSGVPRPLFPIVPSIPDYQINNCMVKRTAVYRSINFRSLFPCEVWVRCQGGNIPLTLGVDIGTVLDSRPVLVVVSTATDMPVSNLVPVAANYMLENHNSKNKIGPIVTSNCWAHVLKNFDPVSRAVVANVWGMYHYTGERPGYTRICLSCKWKQFMVNMV